MKIKEVCQPTDEKLFESIEQENKSGYKTSDLVKVVRAHTGKWTKHNSIADLMNYLTGGRKN